MTTTNTPTTATSTASGPTPAPTRVATLAASGLAVAILIVIAGNLIVRKGEQGGTAQALTTAIICLVLTGLLFTLVIPRLRDARAAQRGTIVLGILAVLSLVVFWTGITPVFAAATLAAAERSPQLGRAAKTLRVLAVLATLLTVGWSVANSHWF